MPIHAFCMALSHDELIFLIALWFFDWTKQKGNHIYNSGSWCHLQYLYSIIKPYPYFARRCLTYLYIFKKQKTSLITPCSFSQGFDKVFIKDLLVKDKRTTESGGSTNDFPGQCFAEHLNLLCYVYCQGEKGCWDFYLGAVSNFSWRTPPFISVIVQQVSDLFADQENKLL